MNALLYTLEKMHRIDSKEIAMQLGVTLNEYVLLEAGIQQLTPEQIVRLMELLKTHSSETQHPAPVTIYNIGQHNHAATNVTVYIEDWNTSQTSANMKTTIEQQAQQPDERKSMVLFTPQLIGKLHILKKVMEELGNDTAGKTYDQFIAERDCIIDLLKELDKEAIKHDVH